MTGPCLCGDPLCVRCFPSRVKRGKAPEETVQEFVLYVLYESHGMSYADLRRHDVHRGRLRVALRRLMERGLISGWKDKQFECVVSLTYQGNRFVEEVLL